MFRRLLSFWIIVSFSLTSIIPPQKVYAQGVLGLPEPGAMISLSAAYEPVLIKGLKINPENPLNLDFIVATGNSQLTAQDQELKSESNKLIKYFLAALTLPEKDVWVNLSPYEKDRIVPDATGETEMGRDMLAQDYVLKQITASLIYPEKGLGKDFWNKIYTQAQQRFGTTQIPVNTFNKVWIVADKASVYEAKNTVMVVDAHLKVMLEEDYEALNKHDNVGAIIKGNDAHALGSKIVREIVLPALETEVNQGKNFANLRQIFHSLILAKWYKENLKTALLNQVYSDKNKVAGVDVEDKTIKEQIYQQYLQAYKKGVFNFIKEDIDQTTKQPMPRKYFSGGLRIFGPDSKLENATPAMLRVNLAQGNLGSLEDVSVTAAMNSLGKSVKASLPSQGSSAAAMAAKTNISGEPMAFPRISQAGSHAMAVLSPKAVRELVNDFRLTTKKVRALEEEAAGSLKVFIRKLAEATKEQGETLNQSVEAVRDIIANISLLDKSGNPVFEDDDNAAMKTPTSIEEGLHRKWDALMHEGLLSRFKTGTNFSIRRDPNGEDILITISHDGSTLLADWKGIFTRRVPDLLSGLSFADAQFESTDDHTIKFKTRHLFSRGEVFSMGQFSKAAFRPAQGGGAVIRVVKDDEGVTVNDNIFIKNGSRQTVNGVLIDVLQDGNVTFFNQEKQAFSYSLTEPSAAMSGELKVGDAPLNLVSNGQISVGSNDFYAIRIVTRDDKSGQRARVFVSTGGSFEPDKFVGEAKLGEPFTFPGRFTITINEVLDQQEAFLTNISPNRETIKYTDKIFGVLENGSDWSDDLPRYAVTQPNVGPAKVQSYWDSIAEQFLKGNSHEQLKAAVIIFDNIINNVAARHYQDSARDFVVDTFSNTPYGSYERRFAAAIIRYKPEVFNDVQLSTAVREYMDSTNPVEGEPASAAMKAVYQTLNGSSGNLKIDWAFNENGRLVKLKRITKVGLQSAGSKYDNFQFIDSSGKVLSSKRINGFVSMYGPYVLVSLPAEKKLSFYKITLKDDEPFLEQLWGLPELLKLSQVSFGWGKSGLYQGHLKGHVIQGVEDFSFLNGNLSLKLNDHEDEAGINLNGMIVASKAMATADAGAEKPEGSAAMSGPDKALFWIIALCAFAGGVLKNMNTKQNVYERNYAALELNHYKTHNPNEPYLKYRVPKGGATIDSVVNQTGVKRKDLIDDNQLLEGESLEEGRPLILSDRRNEVQRITVSGQTIEEMKAFIYGNRNDTRSLIVKQGGVGFSTYFPTNGTIVLQELYLSQAEYLALMKRIDGLKKDPNGVPILPVKDSAFGSIGPDQKFEPGSPTGGIDLDASKFTINKTGSGVEIKFSPAVIEQFRKGDFSGILPIITSITPIVDIYPMLGLRKEEDEEHVAKV